MFFFRANDSSCSFQTDEKSYEQQISDNPFMSSIATHIEDNDVDLQTKRLYKRYVARKHQDNERKIQVNLKKTHIPYQCETC